MSNKKALSNWIVQTGDERIELPLKVLETLVIPLDQSPRISTAFISYTELFKLSRK